MNALIFTTWERSAPAFPSVASMLSNVASASARMPPVTTFPSAPKPTLPDTWINRPAPLAVTASLKPDAGLVVMRSMLIVCFLSGRAAIANRSLDMRHYMCARGRAHRPQVQAPAGLTSVWLEVSRTDRGTRRQGGSAQISSGGTAVPKLGMGPIRREQICRAAATVIAREGFAGSTMRMVAEEAGVSTGMINHYFANRQDLLTQALVFVSERTQERYRRAIEDVPPGRERLATLLDSALADDEEMRETWYV